MSCKGICSRYRATGSTAGGRYAQGQKRCQVCEIFIKWDGRHCPCCFFQLRIKPRRLKEKKKFRESKIKTTPNSEISNF